MDEESFVEETDTSEPTVTYSYYWACHCNTSDRIVFVVLGALLLLGGIMLIVGALVFFNFKDLYFLYIILCGLVVIGLGSVVLWFGVRFAFHHMRINSPPPPPPVVNGQQHLEKMPA
jgi:hypothetical protein